MNKFAKLISSSLVVGSLFFTSVQTTFAATYTVKSGDYLYKIAKNNNTTVDSIMKSNRLKNTTIRVGQKLTIPTKKVSSTKTTKVNSYSMSEIDLMAKLVRAEAGGEPQKGKVAVAAVVINRTQSKSFPKTVSGVIYQKNAFSPVRSGSINKPADSNSRKAAIEAAKGSDPTKNAVFFYNPKHTKDRWIKSRPITTKIGNHNFAK